MVAKPHRIALLLAGGIILLWLMVMALALNPAGRSNDAGGYVLVLFPPGEDAFGAIIRAGGRPVRRTELPLVWIANGEAPNFAQRLEDEGAIATLLSFPLMPVMGGCLAITGLDLPAQIARGLVP